MQHQLENAHIQVKVNAQGAEVCNLVHKKHGIEYLWTADPQEWPRHAPVLFPIVGKLKDDAYLLNGKIYPMGQHGFARDLPWALVDKSRDSLTFRLEESDETLKKYPFSFVLEAKYSLRGTAVSVTYALKNSSKEDLPFSLGAHPGFNCPLIAESRFEDYYLEFEKEENLHKQLLKNGLRTGSTEPILQNSNILSLSQQLFKEDALVFEGVQSDWVVLRSRKHAHGVKVFFEGFPYLGIWTKSETSPFLCIEPWYGVADRQEGSVDFRMKEGVRLLKPGQSFACTYTIEVF